MNDNIYTDLALESCSQYIEEQKNTDEIQEKDLGDVKLLSLKIDTQERSELYRRPIGTYVTLSCKKIWLMSELEAEAAAQILANEISNMIYGLTDKKSTDKLSVLVVGLGNSDITPDAVGPLTVSHLTVTRHISVMNSELFSKIGHCEVSAFIPGVLAQTGIETLELIKGAVNTVTPDIVIAVDALAARSCERLAATIQLSDAGIEPGSGIGNKRKAIDKNNLGVPVIALGVPTVVDSATLVTDALAKAGIYEIPEKLEGVLSNGKAFFVSPKECDVISNCVAVLLARALDNAFQTN